MIVSINRFAFWLLVATGAAHLHGRLLRPAGIVVVKDCARTNIP